MMSCWLASDGGGFLVHVAAHGFPLDASLGHGWEMCSRFPDVCADFLKRLFVEAIAVGIFTARRWRCGDASMSRSRKEVAGLQVATLRRRIFRLDEDLRAGGDDVEPMRLRTLARLASPAVKGAKAQAGGHLAVIRRR